MSVTKNTADLWKTREKTIAIVVPDVLGVGATGPAIRCMEMARQLVESFQVTLLVNKEPSFLIPRGVGIELYTAHDIGARLSKYQIVISRGLDYQARYMAMLQNVQIFDMYDPVLLELQAGNLFAETVPVGHLKYLCHLTHLMLKRGSYFICASPQQRDLWLGSLYVSGRLLTSLHRQATRADELIGVAPFGHDASPPQKGSQAIKGVIPGINPNDRLLIWNGGIWNWFDTEVLLQAMKRLQAKRPEIKLLFMGVKHPHESFEGDQLAHHTQRLSAEMGLTGKSVFFNETWVPYDQRGNFLLEADLAVCTAPAGLENHFSFRTRLMDALWAKLPYLCSQGDFFSGLAEKEGVGLVAPPGSVGGVATQILTALEPHMMDRMKSNLDRIWGDYCWKRCLEPLVNYCKEVPFSRKLTPGQRWNCWYDYVSYLYATRVEEHFSFSSSRPVTL